MNYKYIDKNKVYLKDEDMFRFLDIDGNLIKGSETTITKEQIKEAYHFMVLSRQLDTYMSQLQRQGRMLTFAPNFGEEALQVATSLNIGKTDFFVPAFRSNATMLHLGVTLKQQMLYWNGNENGSKMGENVNVLPINVPIATQISHATGIALGMKYKKDKSVAVTYIGNGGTAEGEFYEAMNFGAIHGVPAVYCINNNRWSISTPEVLESHSATLAAKAVAAGIPALRVDGNDLLASYEILKEATNYARQGNGPILVELVTWREGPHTTSDNPRIYRTEESEIEAVKWEPFHRIEKYMFDNNIMTADEKEKIWADILTEVKAEYQASLKELDVTIDEVFDYTYEKLTPELLEQKQDAIKMNGGK